MLIALIVIAVLLFFVNGHLARAANALERMADGYEGLTKEE